MDWIVFAFIYSIPPVSPVAVVLELVLVEAFTPVSSFANVEVIVVPSVFLPNGAREVCTGYEPQSVLYASSAVANVSKSDATLDFFALSVILR